MQIHALTHLQKIFSHPFWTDLESLKHVSFAGSLVGAMKYHEVTLLADRHLGLGRFIPMSRRLDVWVPRAVLSQVLHLRPNS